MTRSVRWPTPLDDGDRIAVVAPCGVVDPERLAAGVATLRHWGFEPVVGRHVLERHGHLAGTDHMRRADLQAAIDDPALRAIWVVRGGSGATRIVDDLDWRALREVPRWLVGFSDVTALHHAAWRHARVVTCHGHLAGRLDQLAAHPDAAAHLQSLLTGGPVAGPVPELAGHPSPRVLVPGRGTGPLLGGNLSVLCSGIGTRNQLDTSGAVLLLEDVNEPPYRVDRMLTQLRASGMLHDVAGVVLGTFIACDPPAGVASATIEDVVLDRLGDLGVPVLADLPVGHQPRHLALPHGATVTVDTAGGGLALEPADG